jgi:UDP-glucose 4-epimerase
MTWLVTGGAGYIGLHVVRALTAAGEPVVVLDDLSSGRGELLEVPLVVADVGDAAALDHTMREHDVAGVIHLAARKRVAESVADPLLYYRRNVGDLVTLLDAMSRHEVPTIVFSSSAAVYGACDEVPVSEQTPTVPLSPYGETKLVGEWLVRAAAAAHGLRYAVLRYFNVAGAAAPELGDPGAANLIPLVFDRISAGQAPQVFGADYPTPDGTCIRDFIHVTDVAAAHVAALRYLAAGGEDLLLNVGRGEGASVLEVLDVVAAVTGLPTEPEILPRRPGDPPQVVAAADAVRRVLDWQPSHDLESMVRSAWAARTAGRGEAR